MNTDTQERPCSRVLLHVQWTGRHPLSPRNPQASADLRALGACRLSVPAHLPSPCAPPSVHTPLLPTPPGSPVTCAPHPLSLLDPQLSSGSQCLRLGSGLPVGPRFPGDREGLAPGGGAGTGLLQFLNPPPGCALAPLLGAERPPWSCLAARPSRGATFQQEKAENQRATPVGSPWGAGAGSGKEPREKRGEKGREGLSESWDCWGIWS